MQKLNKCTYQVFALIYYGDVVNPFCFLCKLPNLHIWFWTNILIQYGKHHCALKNAKKWFCEILELLTFCAKVTICTLQPPFKLRHSKWCSVSSLTIIEYSATSKGSDQTARMRRLIWGFAGRTYHIVGNLMHRLIMNQSWVWRWDKKN